MKHVKPGAIRTQVHHWSKLEESQALLFCVHFLHRAGCKGLFTTRFSVKYRSISFRSAVQRDTPLHALSSAAVLSKSQEPQAVLRLLWARQEPDVLVKRRGGGSSCRFEWEMRWGSSPLQPLGWNPFRGQSSNGAPNVAPHGKKYNTV